MALHSLDRWLALAFHPIAVGRQRCVATDSSRGFSSAPSMEVRAAEAEGQMQGNALPAVTTRHAGIEPTCKLSAARGPIRLLRRFNGESRHQRRVSEEGSSLLKRRNLRCGGDAATHIARGPAHFGGLWRAA